MKIQSTWEKAADNLWFAEDGCTVYAIQTRAGWVVINAGTGAALKTLSQINNLPVCAVLLTHHFRDHTAAAPQWKELGAKVWAPYWEQDYFINSKPHWISRQTWNNYDNQWDRMAPLSDIPVDSWLMDYSHFNISDLSVEVIPTPGVTMGAVSFLLAINNHQFLAVGEVIHSPGKLYRVSPFQYDYVDLNGLYQLTKSLDRLTDYDAELLLPSKGRPIKKPKIALNELQQNIKEFHQLAAPPQWQFISPRFLTLNEFAPGAFFVAGSVASTHFFKSATGKILTLDYGYECINSPLKIHRSNKRPILLCPKEQRRVFGTDQIALAIPTHYHDDHINGFALLQRLYNTKVWAPETYADLLERPERYDMPCLWHEPVIVHKKCRFNETLEWEGMQIRLYPTSGHTTFGNLIEIKHNGVTFVHTGDQIFFESEGHSDHACYSNSRLTPNHVYKNGLDLGGYHETLRQIESIQPDWIMTGHTAPYPMNADYYRIIKEGADRWDALHRKIMPLGEQEVHFGPESQAARLFPYRTILEHPERIQFDAWVLNPYPHKVDGTAKLVAPEGWNTSPITFTAGPREKTFFSLTLTPPDNAQCLRQPIGLEIWLDERPFGQVTEALVSIAEEQPWQSP